MLRHLYIYDKLHTQSSLRTRFGCLLLWSSIYIFIYSFIIFGPSFGHHLYALQPFWTYLSVHVHVLPFLTRNRHPPPATPAHIPLFFLSLFSVLPQRTWVISALMAKPCGRKELIELETCSFQTRWSKYPTFPSPPFTLPLPLLYASCLYGLGEGVWWSCFQQFLTCTSTFWSSRACSLFFFAELLCIWRMVYANLRHTARGAEIIGHSVDPFKDHSQAWQRDR